MTQGVDNPYQTQPPTQQQQPVTLKDVSKKGGAELARILAIVGALLTSEYAIEGFGSPDGKQTPVPVSVDAEEAVKQLKALVKQSAKRNELIEKAYEKPFPTTMQLEDGTELDVNDMVHVPKADYETLVNSVQRYKGEAIGLTRERDELKRLVEKYDKELSDHDQLGVDLDAALKSVKTLRELLTIAEGKLKDAEQKPSQNAYSGVVMYVIDRDKALAGTSICGPCNDGVRELKAHGYSVGKGPEFDIWIATVKDPEKGYPIFKAIHNGTFDDKNPRHIHKRYLTGDWKIIAAMHPKNKGTF